MSTFIADVGGVAGLWIGASLLTYIEAIDLLWHLMQVSKPKIKCAFSASGEEP